MGAERVVERFRHEIVHSVEEFNVVVVSGYPDSHLYSFVPFYLFASGFAEPKGTRRNPPKICAAFTNREELYYYSDLCSALTVDKSKVTVLDADYNVKSEVVYTLYKNLIKKLLVDPLLSEFSVFVLCGVQERSLESDLLIALLKRVLTVRSRVRLVLLSQSPNIQAYRRFFTNGDSGVDDGSAEPSESGLGDVHCIKVEDDSRYYRVHYISRPTSNYMESVISTVIELSKECDGNILVFVPGRENAQYLRAELQSVALLSVNGFSDISLTADYYSSSGGPNEGARRSEGAGGGRKKVLICGDLGDYKFGVGEVACLVDACLTHAQTPFNPNALESVTGSENEVKESTREELLVRASVIRNRGDCYRLITEDYYNSKIQETVVPEIMTSDLTLSVLLLKSLGVGRLCDFDFLTKPPAESIQNALTILYLLNAIDAKGELVYPVGNLMAELQVTPYLSNFLYKSIESGCSEEALIIYSTLQVKDILWKKFGKVYRNEASYLNERLESVKLSFAALEGDLISYFNLFQLAKYYKDEDSQWLSSHMINERALKLAQKIKSKTTQVLNKYHLQTKSCDGDVDLLVKTIFSGFFLNVACKEHLIQNYQSSKQMRKNPAAPDSQTEQPYVLIKSFELSNYKRMYIHPSSFIANEQPDWVVFNELSSAEGKIYMHDVTTIRPEYLQEVAPYYFGAEELKPYLVDF